MTTLRRSLPAFVLGFAAAAGLMYFRPAAADAQAAAAVPANPAPTPKGVYRVFTMAGVEAGSGDNVALAKRLNEVAADGWEIKESVGHSLILFRAH